MFLGLCHAGSVMGDEGRGRAPSVAAPSARVNPRGGAMCAAM
jgi:hypothetical protein